MKAQIINAFARQLKPLMDSHTFMLDDISKAHTLLESGKAKGKIIVEYSNV